MMIATKIFIHSSMTNNIQQTANFKLTRKRNKNYREEEHTCILVYQPHLHTHHSLTHTSHTHTLRTNEMNYMPALGSEILYSQQSNVPINVTKSLCGIFFGCVHQQDVVHCYKFVSTLQLPFSLEGRVGENSLDVDWNVTIR